jgi:hypothetical protein
MIWFTWFNSRFLLFMLLKEMHFKTSRHCTYELWLWSSRNDFIATIPVYLQLTEYGHLQSTATEQPCTKPNDTATIGNIYGTPDVEIFQWRRHIFSMTSVSWNLQRFQGRFYIGNSQKSFGANSGEQGGRSFSLIDFGGQKLLDGECLVSWSIVMVENPIVGPKFGRSLRTS